MKEIFLFVCVCVCVCVCVYIYIYIYTHTHTQDDHKNNPYFQVQGDTKKRELLKNPTKIEEIQEKKLLTEIEPLQLAF